MEKRLTVALILFHFLIMLSYICVYDDVQDIFSNNSVFKKFWFQNWWNNMFVSHMTMCKTFFLIIAFSKSFDFKTDAIKFCATYIRFVPHTRYFYNIIRVSKVLFQKLMQWYDISIVVLKSLIFIIIQLDKKR